jgi:hypothetical protein
MFITTNLTAQDYYPLEIGNRWDYEVWFSNENNFKTISNYSIEVISDSMFSNGKTYYVLSDYDLTGGRYVRADNDFVYYYDEDATEEDTIYHLNAQVGDFWEVWFGPTAYISVEEIDTTELFTFSSRVMKFRLDGLILKYVNLSDLFGPSYFHFPGEPPGTSNIFKFLVGGILSGVEFGEPLSAGHTTDSKLSSFTLSQNYPNPFNPSTSIQYSVSRRQFVSLRVYDVLGNEIATLVNEEKPSGIYEVEWNAGGFTSGIYFYQLQTEGYVETKKTLLLK